MTLPEYSRRMNRVLDHIDRHLDQPLALDELARIAHFSAFHFHRVCAAWLGETLGDYLQRRRLAAGAALLATRQDESVLSIAVSVGFGSGEAFARAFKRRFGCTPSAWRAQTPARWAEQLEAVRARRLARQSNLDQDESKPDQAPGAAAGDHEDSHTTPMEYHMSIQFRDFPATRVAYLRKIGPYGAPVSAFLAEAFLPWLRANGLDGQPWFGISHDDPSITPAQKCRYDACVAVPEDFAPGGQAMLTTLPGGRYAVGAFLGTAPTIGDAWTEMFRDWLPASGMQCDARPVFEHYTREFHYDPATGVFNCELCIPVKAL